MILKLIFVAFVLRCGVLAVPQLGLKTHNNLQVTQNISAGWNFHGSNQYVGHNNWTFANPTEGFINRTRAEMNDGVCTKEVPTASLVHPNGQIPPGNGVSSSNCSDNCVLIPLKSHPSLSSIHVCCDGYTQNPHNLRKCDPVCEKECINGLCVAPNLCSCYPDYVLNQLSKCVPTCPIGCENGVGCDGTKCICKEGFELDPTQKFCVAKCSQGCLNGVCVGPEECLCNEGYKYSADKKCVPICRNGCENGDCISPDVCSCKKGYTKNSIGLCEPICSRGCGSGKCIAPEQCSCSPGWTFDATASRCEARCDQACLNGVCNGPNVCECHRGYVLDGNNPFMCVAHCPNGCPNGVCSGPGFCLCNAGFVKDRSVKGSQACVPRH